MSYEDRNGVELEEGMDVIILGKITTLAGGIHPVANVQVTQQGQTQTLTFYCQDLRQAEIDGNTITGVLGGGT